MDPIKAIDDTIAVWRYGQGVTLSWTTDKQRYGAVAEMLLRSYGVKVYKRQYAKRSGDEAALHVVPAQAKFADGLMRGAGFAMTSPKLSKPIKPKSRWNAPAKPVGLAGRILDGVLGLAD